MPNNESDHLQETLTRIQKLLSASESMSPQEETPAATQNLYVANPTLSNTAITRWEKANQVTLPEAYRLFLLEVGNGGKMPGSYCDFVIHPLDLYKADSDLAKPFPISQARLQQRLVQLATDEEYASPFLIELSQYAEEDKPPGCLNLGHYPSFDGLFLVVTGELKGTVWCKIRDGVPEINSHKQIMDFMEWFEDTLLDLGDTD